MKHLVSTFIFIQSIFGLVYADFCEGIATDLKKIIHKSEAIQGEFKSVVPFPGQGGSFINQVYLVTTDEGKKLVLKVENARWPQEKTLNEVATLKYIKQHTSIPVPTVLTFENVALDSLIGHEYILMNLMEGKPFNHEFERIYTDPNLYYNILEQLADIIAELRELPFYSLGSLKDSYSNDLKCPVDFANLGYTTPCETFSEYARRWLQYYLDEMNSLKDSEHPNREYFKKYIPQVEQILASGNLSIFNPVDEAYFFSHQDFVMKNILIDESGIAAVLDWEWSGAAVSEFEPKTGFDFLKTSKDVALFDSLLKKRGVQNFFQPPNSNRQLFYQVIGELYTVISCHEWIEGKLEHSAKFLDQKLEQRRVRSSKDFDIQSYIEDISNSLDIHINQINQILI